MSPFKMEDENYHNKHLQKMVRYRKQSMKYYSGFLLIVQLFFQERFLLSPKNQLNILQTLQVNK